MPNIETSFTKRTGIDPVVTNDLNSLVKQAQANSAVAAERLADASSTLDTVEQKLVEVQTTSSQLTVDAASAVATTQASIDVITNTAISTIIDTATTSAQNAANNATAGVTNTANQAIATITSTKDTAVSQINTAAQSAIDSVSNSSASVISATNQGISDVNEARDDAIAAISGQVTTVTNSATAAANSATAANTAKTAAEAAKGAAETASTSASGSASTATTKASAASTSASNAATSATNASGSASAAATSATNAAGSATAAANSATAAANSATAAQNAATGAVPLTGGDMTGQLTITTASTPGLVVSRSATNNIGIQISNPTYAMHIGMNSIGVPCISTTANFSADGKPIATTNGTNTWTAGQTFPSETAVSSSSGDVNLKFNAPVGQNASLKFSKGWVNRWTISSDNASESGSNAGSNLSFMRFNDSGAYIDTPFQISRSNGQINCGSISSVGSVTATGTISAPILSVDSGTSLSIGAGGPVLALDASDQIYFNRANNTLSFLIASSNKLSVSPTTVTANVPLILPASQSSTSTAAVHKSYVDGQVSLRAALSGAAFTGNIDINKSLPSITLRYSGVKAWQSIVDGTGALVFRDADSGAAHAFFTPAGTLQCTAPRGAGIGRAMVDAANRFGPWQWVDNGSFIQADVDGNAVAITTSGSDERIKEDIAPATQDALPLIRQIEFKDFRYKKLPGAPADIVLPLQTGGVIAQQVQAIKPEWVNAVGPNAMLNLNTTLMLTNALQAIKELADQVDALKAQLATQGN